MNDSRSEAHWSWARSVWGPAAVVAVAVLLWFATRSRDESPPRIGVNPPSASLASPSSHGPRANVESSPASRESIPAPGVPAKNPWAVTSIRGTVVDQLGVGVAGAKVSWFSFEHPNRVKLELTATDGSFRLEPTERTSTHSLQAVAGSQSSKRLMVQAGQNVELRLAPSREVQCVVVDPGGAPVAGAYVELLIGNRYAAVAKTDSRGMIERQNTPVAELRARVVGADLVTRIVEEPKPYRDPWVIVVERAEVELSGVVTSDGMGVEGVSVRVSGRRGSPLETDARGAFRLGLFPRGKTVTASFEHPRLRPSMTCVRAEPGEFLKIELRPGRSAEVFVVDAANNAPVVGARVVCDWDISMALTLDSPASGVTVGPRAVTDAEGRVRFSNLIDQAVGLAVRADGFNRLDAVLPVTERFVVRLDRESVCEVAVAVPFEIAHLTRDAEWTLSLYRGSDSPRPDTLAGTYVLDRDLAVTLRGLPPGEYDYSLESGDATWHSRGAVTLLDRAHVRVPGPDGVKYPKVTGNARYRATGDHWSSESGGSGAQFLLYRLECEAAARAQAFLRKPGASDFDTEVPWNQVDVR